MTERPRVCVVGSLHLDIMVRAPHLPRIGETLMGDTWWWKQGGKGGNQAVAAARHGARVAMIGRLGDDEFGTWLRGRLATADVGIGWVRAGERGSGMSVAIQQDTGDYAAIVVSGANAEIDPAQVEESAAAIRESRVLVLQHEVGEAANVAAARLARESGVPVILNAAPARPIGALGGLVDTLVVNAVEAEQLGGGSVDDLEQAAVAGRALLPLAPAVVVTAGGSGVAVATSHESVMIAAHPVAGAETHGAGDVFVGAFAARTAATDPLDAAIRYANAAAALHVSSSEADRERLGPDDVARLLAAPASRSTLSTGSG